jgi:hypothetical protein
MRALRLDSLNVDQLRELDDLYRTTSAFARERG